jgi:NAD(P)-dependent dehydrogenase (short-subunit alcohol dehydrogenase family)
MIAPPPSTCFVTGGTGFIGRHLVARLLRRGDDVRLLVRPASLERHHERLARLSALAGAPGAGRLTLCAGDVLLPDLGLADPAVALADHVFHAAALYDLEAAPEALQEVNVGGTRHLLELLRRLGFRGTLHHVSSVAVAGSYRGRFLESMLDEGQSWPHPYHRSKLEAERLVRASGLRHRIYRPGAVVGDSRTGEADRADGAYFFFKPLSRLRGALPSWVPLAAPDGAGLPIVPVDFVADAIAHLAHADRLDGRTFHVVDPASPDLRRTLDTLSRATHGPRFRHRLPSGRLRAASGLLATLAGPEALAHWRRRLVRRLGAPETALDAWNPDVSFDTAHLEAALAGSPVHCPPLASYARVLWRYWEDHLDPDRDPEAKRRQALEGRRVLVTGASSGVGEALALLLGRYGARVLLVARRADRLAGVAAAVTAAGGEAHAVAADLSDLADCDRVVAYALEALGGVDVLVNNAGKSIRRTVAESVERFHDYERTMQLNYFAAVRLTLGLLPAMRAQRRGHVVNVLTSGIWVGTPRFGAYLASKRALDGFSDSLAAELHHEGIRVSAIYLPFVRTPMVSPTKEFDDLPMMTPEHAASWIADALVGRKRRVAPRWASLIGLSWVLDPGGQTRTLNTLLRATSSDKTERAEVALERRLLKLLGVRGQIF